MEGIWGFIERHVWGRGLSSGLAGEFGRFSDIGSFSWPELRGWFSICLGMFPLIQTVLNRD